MKEIVKYHNDFNMRINFKGFSRATANILMSICTKMKDKKEEKVIFTFEELEKMTQWKKNDRVSFIRNIEKTNENLLKLNFKIKIEQEGKKEKRIQFVLFPTFEIDLENETLTVEVHKQFSYLLNNLVDNFTEFDLMNFTSLNSLYLQLLFKELMQFKTTGFRVFKLEDFKEKLDLSKSFWKISKDKKTGKEEIKYNISNITDRILEPAKLEFSKILKNFKYEFDTSSKEKKEKKKGRKKYTLIKFTFKPIKIDNIEEAEIIKEKEKTELTEEEFKTMKKELEKEYKTWQELDEKIGILILEINWLEDDIKKAEERIKATTDESLKNRLNEEIVAKQKEVQEKEKELEINNKLQKEEEKRIQEEREKEEKQKKVKVSEEFINIIKTVVKIENLSILDNYIFSDLLEEYGEKLVIKYFKNLINNPPKEKINSKKYFKNGLDDLKNKEEEIENSKKEIIFYTNTKGEEIEEQKKKKKIEITQEEWDKKIEEIEKNGNIDKTKKIIQRMKFKLEHKIKK